MYPEDTVIVGVINRKKDLQRLLKARWYRIPQKQMPRGIHADYLAFFLSGRSFKERSGSVQYYAPVKGLELVYRRDLFPDEAQHPRANEVYYKVALGDVIEKQPPVHNTSRRVITFIYTTWDRFVSARTIDDLYSEADYFVDRIYHALRSAGLPVERTWQVENRLTSSAAELRILCEDGVVIASTQDVGRHLYLDKRQKQDSILAAILAQIQQRGGPATTNIPVD